MMEMLLVALAVALIAAVIKDARRMSENDKIRAEFEEFLRTGNDKPWRKK